MYEVPAEAERVDQGHLVKTNLFETQYEAGLAVVVTPECDLENKADFVSLAAVGFPQEVMTRIGVTSKSKAADRVGGLVSGREYRWYFLQPTAMVTGFEAGAFVDFQLVTSVPMENSEDLTAVAALRTPWRQEMASRYAAFAGRVGTDDVPRGTLQEWRRGLVDLI